MTVCNHPQIIPPDSDTDALPEHTQLFYANKEWLSIHIFQFIVKTMRKGYKKERENNVG